MKDDPRQRNRFFDTANLGLYLKGYAAALEEALLSVDADALERACAAIEAAARGGRRIYSAGNGGSAAIADHLSCDWTKGTHHEAHPTLRTISLNANVALYSAIANDFGFEKVFSTQMTFHGEPGDVLIAISSSGQSANILAVVEEARRLGVVTIGMSGFTGGGLRDAADIVLHVDASNYGIVEDAHQALAHILTQYIARRRDQG